MNVNELAKEIKTYQPELKTLKIVKEKYGTSVYNLRPIVTQLRQKSIPQVYQQPLVDDVRLQIYQNLEIDDIVNACYTDKYAVKLCSSKQFWDIIFAKYNLPLSTITFKNVNDWILAFTNDVLFSVERKKKMYLPLSLYIYSMAISFSIYISQKYQDIVSRSLVNKGIECYFHQVLDDNFKKLAMNELITSGKVIQIKQSFKLSSEFYKEIEKLDQMQTYLMKKYKRREIVK